MKFEIEAVISEIGQIETFGQKGFQKRNLILTEKNGEYENPVCIEWSGDKLARPESHQIGQMVKVSGFINCREYEGRYFTSLAGSYIENVGQTTQPQTTQAPAFGAQPQPSQAPVQQYQQQVAPQHIAQPVAPQQVAQPATVPQQPVYAQTDQPPRFDPNTGQPLVEDDIPF